MGNNSIAAIDFDEEIEDLLIERRLKQETELIEKVAKSDKEKRYLKKWFKNACQKEADALNVWHDYYRFYKYGDDVEELSRHETY